MNEDTSRAQRLRELAALFLRLGTLGFGGPAAHIAMMDEEVVRKRRWLSREEFLDLLGATNLIPGPNSTEMAIHIGYRRAGWLGLIVAGASFIFPAAAITLGIAWGYARYGTLPQVAGVLYGVKPVILAVILHAFIGLFRTAVKTRALGVLLVAAIVAALAGVNELLVLVVCGAIVATVSRRTRPGESSRPIVPIALAAANASGAVAPFSTTSLALVFLKCGSLLFGSGYVLLAYLRADLVERLGWLSEKQLLDAIAVGQLTPGPVFTTATFIGYVLDGPRGAAIATTGIFFPAFVFVAISGTLVARIRRSPAAGAFLDGVNVGSLALMATVAWPLGRAAIVDPWTAGIAISSAVILLRFRISSSWLVLVSAVVGAVVYALPR